MKPENLIKQANLAKNRAFSPYSDYAVGAALLTQDNYVILGCNIESKAYPTTICAERVAFFSAISQGYNNFSALALITNDGAYPCGSCRQIISEFAKDLPIYIASSLKDYVITNISDLLPHPFR